MALAFAAFGMTTTQAGKINFANFFFWSTGRISFRFRPALIHLGPGLQGPRADLSILSRKFLGPLARAGAACRPWDSHSCYKCGGFAGLSDQLGVHVPRVLLASCSCDMTSTCMIGRCRVVLSNMKCKATTTLMLLSLQERPANRYPQHPHRKNKGQKTLAEVVVVYIRVVLIQRGGLPAVVVKVKR